MITAIVDLFMKHHRSPSSRGHHRLIKSLFNRSSIFKLPVTQDHYNKTAAIEICFTLFSSLFMMRILSTFQFASYQGAVSGFRAMLGKTSFNCHNTKIILWSQGAVADSVWRVLPECFHTNCGVEHFERKSLATSCLFHHKLVDW